MIYQSSLIKYLLLNKFFIFISLKEKQYLPTPGKIRIGAGVLALSYIDEKTVMSAGYDTFIRIFDLRSNQWYILYQKLILYQFFFIK